MGKLIALGFGLLFVGGLCMGLGNLSGIGLTLGIICVIMGVGWFLNLFRITKIKS